MFQKKLLCCSVEPIGKMQSVIRTAVLLGSLAHVLGGPALQFGPCSASCGGGEQTAVYKVCPSQFDAGQNFPCKVISVNCNTQPCQNLWSQWTDCSEDCGGGTRQRSSVSGFLEVVTCNSISCAPKTVTGCPADIVFAIDGSETVGQYRFDNFKQMAMDIERSLPVGQNEMHIGYVQYSATANAVFSLRDSFDPAVIAQNIWASGFRGGASCAANGLAGVRDMFAASGSANYPRVAVFFTDGPDNRAALIARDIADALRQNIDMYVVRDVVQVDMDDNLGSVLKAVMKADAKSSGKWEERVSARNDGNEETGSVTMKEERKQESTTETCSEFSDYGECSASCGATGYKNRAKWCVTFGANGNKENVTYFEYEECFIPCPTTTTTEPTSTTEPTTTTTVPTTSTTGQTTSTVPTTTTTTPTTTTTVPTTTTTVPTTATAGPYPDCARCNYTKGQVWFPDPDNCHLYYICDKIDRMDGSWYFRIYHPTCGQLAWDQERLTCVRSNANCTDAVVEYTPPSTTFVNFDDITCHNAKGYSYGDGEVQIVFDSVRNQNVAEFDGKSRIEVAFMRNWLQDQNQRAWTVTAWVNRVPGPFDYVGIVDNGDCKDSASFLLYGNVDASAAPCAYGGIAAGNGFPATETGRAMNVPYGVWVHLAVVYDGSSVSLFVDGVRQNTLSSSLAGAMLNTQNPLYVGMQGCCDDIPGYFKGRIDDVRVYTVALNAAEILAM
ncbi:hypothetical protein LSAT2_016582 [Lamellibrachia satsuma]|nr:hypothetical protein LSAT2_016582 [Lamellibrachia satsuma]